MIACWIMERGGSLGKIVSRKERLRTLTRSLSSLSFSRPMFSGALERDFIEDARAFRGKRQWLESFISIALYTVFAVLSLVAAPEGHSLESRLRFELVIPLLLLLNLAFWFRFATWLRDMATLITSGIAGSVEILTHLSPTTVVAT